MGRSGTGRESDAGIGMNIEQGGGDRAVPRSVRVPRIVGDGTVIADVAEYPLIGFPWEPWTLTAWLELTQAQAGLYANWLNETGTDRIPVILKVLGEAGAPVAGLREQPDDLAALGSWAQSWFPLVAAPLVAQGFLHDNAADRLGEAFAAWGPSLSSFSPFGDALLHSLAHDLAFVVADCARAARPGLRWQAAADEWRNFFVTVNHDPPLFDVIVQIKDFLVQSVARRRGARSTALRRWYSRLLYGCYQWMATGADPPLREEEFPDLRARMYPRYELTRPSRADPPAPQQLAEAVGAFRRAGWFETSKLADADLARAAQVAWRKFEREDIPLTPAEMNWRLLLLDIGRTWSEDVDAGITPQDRLYEDTLFAVERVGGKGFGHFRDPAEDWASRPGDLLLSFTWGRRWCQLLLTGPGRYLSPALVTGLNSLLPAGGQRLWFFDHGPPLGIVTRATPVERNALEQLTGIRLDPEPPSWWAALAPLPPPGTPGPVTRATPRRPTVKALNLPSSGSASDPGSGLDSALASFQPSSPDRERGRRGKAPPAGAPTAQDGFKRLMRDYIGPALRDLGFRGSASRGFVITNGDYSGSFTTQKNRYSTKQQVDFWVHLGAGYDPTSIGYWQGSLAGNGEETWTVRAGEPVEPVAEKILGAFHATGLPAILAALDSPGYPPEPDIRWARTFPHEDSDAASHTARRTLEPIAALLRPAGRDHDGQFANLADGDPGTRWLAVQIIGHEAADDPRALPALLNRLEYDPSAKVRREAARWLRPLARQAQVRHALQSAATQDEDLEVRWQARYAIRLANFAEPGTT